MQHWMLLYNHASNYLGLNILIPLPSLSKYYQFIHHILARYIEALNTSNLNNKGLSLLNTKGYGNSSAHIEFKY